MSEVFNTIFIIIILTLYGIMNFCVFYGTKRFRFNKKRKIVGGK